MTEDKSKLTALIEHIVKARPKFELAPVGMHFDSEQSYALQLLEANPYLMGVALNNPRSLQQCMTNVASIGLSLNPAKKQAYLIPRSVNAGKDANGRNIYETRVFLEPSYMGFCDIATGLGTIEFVQADVVYAEDDFKLQGVDKEPIHIRDPFASKESRGEFRGAYAVARLKKGGYLTTAVSAEDIYKIRDSSETWKAAIKKGNKEGAGPWKDFFDEQAKKTAVRRAYKLWPKSEGMERLDTAIQLSNENENLFMPEQNPETRHYRADQKAYFDNLIERSDAIGLLAFVSSLDEQLQFNLYNSFEDGSKGKFKKIHDELLARGRKDVQDLLAKFQQCLEDADDLGAKEELAGLAQESLDFIKNQCNTELRQYLDQCWNEL